MAKEVFVGCDRWQRAVGSQNRIRRKAQRYVTVNWCRIPAFRGFGQAVPSESFWIRDRGTARHMLFEATF